MYHLAPRCKQTLRLFNICVRDYLSSLTPTSRKLVRFYLTANETAVALRPFYFAVHPDFFGQHPEERKINEESLKRLHEYVTSLQIKGNARPTDLTFYVRNEEKNDMNRVKLQLESHDIRSTISTVLQSAELSLDYLSNIPRKRTGFARPVKWDPTYYHFTDKKNPNQEYYETVVKDKSLLIWLKEKARRAKVNEAACRSIRQEINSLENELITAIGLQSLDWHNNWGVHHCMGCLKTFKSLYRAYKETISAKLRNRRLVFSNRTGVSIQGEILLSTEEVPTDWAKMMSRVEAYDAVLERLPHMEEKLSKLLADIRIVRLHGKQVLLAEEYELLLNKLLNSLRRSQGDVNYYLHGKDLSHLELVVQGESAPLTLSSSGQFLIPASLPGSLVVKFISDLETKAYITLANMQLTLEMEKTVIKECKERLKLRVLVKEDMITPAQMTECCERLMNDAIYLEQYLTDSQLRVTNYYTVMQDGEIGIPWNWSSDIS